MGRKELLTRLQQIVPVTGSKSKGKKPSVIVNRMTTFRRFKASSFAKRQRKNNKDKAKAPTATKIAALGAAASAAKPLADLASKSKSDGPLCNMRVRVINPRATVLNWNRTDTVAKHWPDLETVQLAVCSQTLPVSDIYVLTGREIMAMPASADCRKFAGLQLEALLAASGGELVFTAAGALLQGPELMVGLQELSFRAAPFDTRHLISLSTHAMKTLVHVIDADPEMSSADWLHQSKELNQQLAVAAYAEDKSPHACMIISPVHSEEPPR